MSKNPRNNKSYIPKDLRNFKELSRKNVFYKNIKIHKKTGLSPLSRKYSFRKTTRGRGVKFTPRRFYFFLYYLCDYTCHGHYS